jgi:hypothetical protein
MLDTRDVRVGNWVLKLTGRDVKEQSFFEYKAIALDEYFYTFARECFPIKLSPEILGECGFKHEFGDWYKTLSSPDGEQGVTQLRYRHKEKAWCLGSLVLPAQPAFVHQLQNLYYALTRQELSIELSRFENLALEHPIHFFTDAY